MMFKENDIRPLILKKEQSKYIQEDINFLLKEKNKFVDIDCPTCSKKNETIKFEKNGFTYIECKNCTMLYVSPRPTFTILKEFYANSVNYKFFNDYIFPSSKETRREKIFIPRVEKVIQLCKEQNIETTSILEIGAGYGLFLEEMQKRNIFHNIMGVEASDALHERSEKLGFNVYNGIFEELNIEQKFDVIVSFEVIEHIFNPKSVLSKIYNTLNDNGLLVMTFPNYNGFDIATLMNVSDSIDHEHLNYFNEKSITMLLEKIGFKEILASTPGVMDVDLVRNKILDNKFEANPFIYDICINRYEEIGDTFQNFLIQNKLSSNMMVIAKKNISKR